jgi:hypothetical protein
MSKLAEASRPATTSMRISRVGQHDGPVRQRVRGDRHQHPAGDARVQDRPAGRQRIGGRAGGRGDDQAVGAHVGDELVADVDAQFDHAGGGAAADDHVVERQPSKMRSPSRQTPPSSIERCSSS